LRCSALAVLLAGGCRASHAAEGSPGGGPAAWYDARPLLASLRPAERAGAARAAGVARLEDLPLYDVRLSVDPARRTFTLGEDVWWTNLEGAPLAEVVLRLYANARFRPSAGASPGPGPAERLIAGTCTQGGACTVTAESASAIVVRPAVPVAPGGRLRVALSLEGSLEAIDPSRTNLLAQGLEGLSAMLEGAGAAAGGSGAGGYGLLAVGDGIASLAGFYPVLARRPGGVWERADASPLGDLGPDALSNVHATIELPATAKLAIGGVVLSEAPAAPGRRVVEVAAAMVREVALLSSDAFDVATRRVGDVEVRSYFLASERDAGMRALDVAEHALADFERRFGRYPYPAFVVAEAAVVGGAGGVEFSGLVTAASMLYRGPDGASGATAGASGGAGAAGAAGGLAALLGPEGASALESLGLGSLAGLGRSMLEFVVAHEVAHQWWHGLVGSDSRDRPFCDESLAQYSAMLYLEDRYGAKRAQDEADTNVKMTYQAMRMMGTADGAVDRPVAQFGSAVDYAGLVYGKGPYYYRALRQALGDDAFFALLREYTARNRFRFVAGAGVPDLAATGPRGDVARALAQRWLREVHGDEDLGTLDLGGLAGLLPGGSPGGLLGGLPGARDGGVPDLSGLLGGLPGADAGSQDLDELLRQLMQ
jgi:hypothetical protein